MYVKGSEVQSLSINGIVTANNCHIGIYAVRRNIVIAGGLDIDATENAFALFDSCTVTMAEGIEILSPKGAKFRSNADNTNLVESDGENNGCCKGQG